MKSYDHAPRSLHLRACRYRFFFALALGALMGSFALTAFGAQASAGALVCNSFQEEEPATGWRAVWTRRGNSDVFDASYTGPAGQRGSTVNTVSSAGNSVTMRRTSSTDGNLCTYQGAILADGKTVEGTFGCTMGASGRKWRATGMICGAAPETCRLQASLSNCPVPLEIRDRRRSEVCEICITEWCRNTANPVRVILPQQKDWWGRNAPGIHVFAGGKEQPPDTPLPQIISPMTVDPSRMGGLRCWNSSYGTYPWSLFVSASPSAPAGIVGIPIEVRQRVPGTDRDTVVNLNMQVRVPPGSTPTGVGSGGGGAVRLTNIIQRMSGRALDIDGGDQQGRGNGAKAHLWDRLNVNSQVWQLSALGDGYFNLRTGHSGKCLDIEAQSRNNGAKAHQWDCHSGDSQKWGFVDAGGGLFAIRSKLSGKCLDIEFQGTNNGAKAHQWDCHTGDSQKWQIQEIVARAR